MYLPTHPPTNPPDPNFLPPHLLFAVLWVQLRPAPQLGQGDVKGLDVGVHGRQGHPQLPGRQLAQPVLHGLHVQGQGGSPLQAAGLDARGALQQRARGGRGGGLPGEQRPGLAQAARLKAA